MIFPHPYTGLSFTNLRIGLLGGSFNPAHEGHRAMSLHALKALALDQVWWLVSPQNPLKPEHDTMPYADRLQQARALAAHPKIVVSDIEIRLRTRYTADSLAALHRRFSGTYFVWLMGADNMRQIPQWRRWLRIFDDVPVAVFRRPGYAVNGKASSRFARFRQPAQKGKKFPMLAAPSWLVFENRLHLLSSTAIRHSH